MQNYEIDYKKEYEKLFNANVELSDKVRDYRQDLLIICKYISGKGANKEYAKKLIEKYSNMQNGGSHYD